MLLKLGRDVAPYEIYQMVYILMLLWQHAQFQSPASSKLNITICDSTRQNTWSYQDVCQSHLHWVASLTFLAVFYAPCSYKWEYLISKKQETETEHVAIATSKCVPSGIFRRVQHPCQVSIALLHYWRRYF